MHHLFTAWSIYGHPKTKAWEKTLAEKKQKNNQNAYKQKTCANQKNICVSIKCPLCILSHISGVRFFAILWTSLIGSPGLGILQTRILEWDVFLAAELRSERKGGRHKTFTGLRHIVIYEHKSCWKQWSEYAGEWLRQWWNPVSIRDTVRIFCCPRIFICQVFKKFTRESYLFSH